jgi:hypothetical protein
MGRRFCQVVLGLCRRYRLIQPDLVLQVVECFVPAGAIGNDVQLRRAGAVQAFSFDGEDGEHIFVRSEFV